MARIAYPDEQALASQPDMIARIREQRGGRLPNLYRMLLTTPDLCGRWLDFFTTLRFKSELEGRYRELAILRIAVLNKAPYEFQNHVKPALAAGLAQDRIDAVSAWEGSALFDANERAILAYTDAMTRDIKVPDTTFAAVAGLFDERGILELTMIVASYNMVSRFLEATQIDHD